MPDKERLGAIDMSQSPEWQAFTAKHGVWTVSVDKATGMPHRAIGKPVKISGYSRITKENVAEASIAFIKEHIDIFKLDPNNLKFLSATNVKNKWFVAFAQMHQGMEVLLSKVDLRITNDARVISFIDDYYNGIDIATSPAIPASVANQSAKTGLVFDEKQDKVMSADELYVLPVRLNGKVSYNLVYKVNVGLNYPLNNYTAYVSASTGDVLWRIKETMEASNQVEVKGGIRWESHFSPIDVNPMANLYVKVGSNRYTTDKNGKITFDIPTKQALNITLEGPFAKLIMKDGSSVNYKDSIAPGAQTSVLFSDGNSTIFERTMFYHANYIHDYFKAMDTGMKYMDFQLKVTIDKNFLNGGPNASSDPQTGNITFYGAGQYNNHFSENPGIMYHEYGHSLNAKLYQSKGRSMMINGTCNEAFADLTTAMIFDDNYIGRGAFVDTLAIPNIRNLKNNVIYPDSLTGEVHHDSQILSGAFWDLRELTNIDYMRQLTFWVRYSLVDDNDIGVAFSDWFFETIIEDDDDGDITNGTPHLNSIVTAFNNHRIGTGLFTNYSFEHQPLPDTRDTVNSYKVDFTVKSIEAVGSKVLAPKVVWSTDNFKTSNYADASDKSGIYSAEIPAQKPGTIVKYYMQYSESMTNEEYKKTASRTGFQPFLFVVGYNMAFTDDFELDRGWKSNQTGDNATKGKWERSDPNGISMNLGSGVYSQLENNHTAGGSFCFVTGPATGTTFNAIVNNMPNGVTSFVSPILNISSLQDPILKYYYSFVTVLFSGDVTKNSRLVTQLSSDGGNSWVKADSVVSNASDWKPVILNIKNYVALTDQFRIKFKMIAFPGTNYPSAFSDALVDDIAILSMNNAQVLEIAEEAEVLPSGMSLAVSPNPIQTGAQISFFLPKADYAELKLYSLGGEELALIDRGYMSEGNRTINFNTSNLTKARLNAGAYYIRLRQGNEFISKMVIVE
jgi:hypothetical protein